eukprot:3805972-Rhodomonas_salina.2
MRARDALVDGILRRDIALRLPVPEQPRVARAAEAPVAVAARRVGVARRRLRVALVHVRARHTVSAPPSPARAREAASGVCAACGALGVAHTVSAQDAIRSGNEGQRSMQHVLGAASEGVASTWQL